MLRKINSHPETSCAQVLFWSILRLRDIAEKQIHVKLKPMVVFYVPWLAVLTGW